MISHPKYAGISAYDYELPEDKIARYPLGQRELSKLLVYQAGTIRENIFTDISRILTPDNVLVLNDTRVIPARIIFKKSTGGIIELFCLEPVGFSHQDAMTSVSGVEWKCLVGGAKKWKGDEVLSIHFLVDNIQTSLTAAKISKGVDHFIIRFEWSPQQIIFSEILRHIGQIPLPPYFNRAAEESDTLRYQTVFAQSEGSVASPTAGLHFTTELLKALAHEGIQNHKLTLHVGAGTFKPVTSETLAEHEMHAETFTVSLDLLRFLASDHHKKIIAVGTTTTRTLESLHWIGMKILREQNDAHIRMNLEQWEAYDMHGNFSVAETLGAIVKYCMRNEQTSFTASTSIMITPGYHFRIIDGLFTNFHLPKSTLLLLVSALVGEDWRKIYDYALSHEFRFLSYGDSSLLLK